MNQNSQLIATAQTTARLACSALANACKLLELAKPTRDLPAAQIEACAAELERANVLIMESLMRLD